MQDVSLSSICVGQKTREMPLATIHLFSLADNGTLPALLKLIKASSVKPLVVSKPIRWIIRPERIETDALLNPKWDLLLILEDDKASQDLVSSFFSASPYNLKASKTDDFKIENHWTTTAGVPSRLTKGFLTKTNPALLHPDAGTVPKLTGALNNPLLKDSSQDLSLSSELKSWIGTSESSLPVKGAVSMLNLLAFKPDMKSSYLKYGAAFGETIGAKRGGNAKLVGNIVSKDNSSKWHEFALAHYPSLLHFADMLASKDYQEVNQKYRVPALEDTCILFTSELEIEKLVGDAKASRSKL